MRRTIILAAGLAAAGGLSGCFWLVAGGAGAEAGYVAGQEERSAGETVSDQWIFTKVTGSFVGHSKVGARRIRVTVRKGVVTLKGRVESHEERDTAVNLARAVGGVKKVVDKLAVGK